MLLRGELSTVTLRPAQARVHHGPSRAATSSICNCVHNCQPERRGSHSELLTERPEPPDGTVTALTEARNCELGATARHCPRCLWPGLLPSILLADPRDKGSAKPRAPIVTATLCIH